MKKVKRYLLLLSVLACVLALTACGKKSKDVKPTFDYDESQLVNYITSNTEAMAAMSNKEINKTIDQYSDKKDDEISTTIKEGLEQFKNARSDSKDFKEFYQNKNKETKYKISTTKDEVTVKVTAKFKKRDVKVAYTFGLVDDNLNVTSIMYEPQFSLGEKMEKAALNTVMGLSTVALVLIFLSILISLFKYVSILQNAIVKIVTTIKNAFAKIIGKKDDAIDKTIEQIEYKEEKDSVDDLEVIAAITAAIAMAEQKSTDGFVVRSIRRVPNRKWNR